MSFRTRKRGTQKQIGTIFPVFKKILPKKISVTKYKHEEPTTAKIYKAIKYLKKTPAEIGLGEVIIRQCTKSPVVAGSIMEHGKTIVVLNENNTVKSYPPPVIALIIAHELGHIVLKHKYCGSHYRIRKKDVKKLDIKQEIEAWKFAKKMTRGIKDVMVDKGGTASAMIFTNKKAIMYVI